MIHRLIFFAIIAIDALILFFQTSEVSISATEATLLYGDFSFLQVLIQLSLNIFGQNDFGLRFVMILFHVLSILLMYLISERYIDKKRNRLWLLLMFVLLPGIVSSAIVVNSAGMVIFGLLLFVYLSEKIKQVYLNVLLLFYSCIDIGFAYLFLGLSVYYLMKKQRNLFLYMIGLYFLTSYLYGFDVHGSARGHFLDTIGVYSAIFTPIIFIYIFYSLYRKYLASQTDMLWYISSTILILSLVLSLRQKIAIEHFAPYLIIALPLAAQTFVSSYRVRLKVYRKKYRLAFVLSFIFLIVNTLVVFFNKELYLVIKNPKKHFVYEMHVAKELSEFLIKENITCVLTDARMQKRLKFYNIPKCYENKLQEIDLKSKKEGNVTISYKQRVLYKANVTKVNIQ